MCIPWRWAYVVLMVSALFCSEAPKEAPIALGVSVLAFSWLFLAWLIRLGKPLQWNLSSFALFMFIGLVIVSLPVAMMNGVSTRNWALRGAAPLLFLAVFWLIPIKTHEDARFVIRTLILMFFVWVAKIVGTMFLSDELLLVRWTFITADLLFPYNLAAICILALDRDIGRKTKTFGIALFIILTIGAGYRMHFLLLALFACYLMLRGMQRGRILVPLSIIVLSGIAVSVFALSEAGTEILGRLKDIAEETDSARVKEIHYAYSMFLQSPLVGKGLAYPIPLEVAFYGFEDYLEGVAAAQDKLYENVSYIHNTVMYLLMDMGALGLLAYSFFVLPPIFAGTKNQYLQGDLRTGCRWALFSIVVFTLIAATITLFQFNLLVASLVAVLVATPTSTASSRNRS